MLTLRKIKAAAKQLKVRTLLPLKAVQEVDRGTEDVQSESPYYPTRAAIAKLIQPRKFAMLGLRFGYDAMAMISQCERLGSFWSWDNESAVQGSNIIAIGLLKARFPRLMLYCYTQHTSHLDSSGEQSMDLVHIDGSKEQGQVRLVLRDLTNARCISRMGMGYILLDDTNMESVSAAFDEWRERPDSQDLAVLEIPDDPKGLVLIGPKEMTK